MRQRLAVLDALANDRAKNQALAYACNRCVSSFVLAVPHLDSTEAMCLKKASLPKTWPRNATAIAHTSQQDDCLWPCPCASVLHLQPRLPQIQHLNSK